MITINFYSLVFMALLFFVATSVLMIYVSIKNKVEHLRFLEEQKKTSAELYDSIMHSLESQEQALKVIKAQWERIKNGAEYQEAETKKLFSKLTSITNAYRTLRNEQLKKVQRHD